jgi:hypothetical protein
MTRRECFEKLHGASGYWIDIVNPIKSKTTKDDQSQSRQGFAVLGVPHLYSK